MFPILKSWQLCTLAKLQSWWLFFILITCLFKNVSIDFTGRLKMLTLKAVKKGCKMYDSHLGYQNKPKAPAWKKNILIASDFTKLFWLHFATCYYICIHYRLNKKKNNEIDKSRRKSQIKKLRQHWNIYSA